MKKLIPFLLALSISVNAVSQEWMTSLEVAKSLASVQNKMIFMMWEEATWEPYPVLIRKDKRGAFVNLFEDPYVLETLWDYFVPVIVNESRYDALFSKIEGKRNLRYINNFNDDSIKIMDPNGNIIDVFSLNAAYLDLERFVNIYGLKTNYISQDLKNYRKEQNFYTTFRLASKYIDYSLFVNKAIRKKFMNLSDIYLKEAQSLLSKSNVDSKLAFQQKSELLKLKRYLILNKPKRVLKALKKFNTTKIDTINKPLEAFLYYTAYKLLKDETEADIWKSKVSLVDLQYTQLIININS